MSRILESDVARQLLVNRILCCFSLIPPPSLDSLYLNKSSKAEYGDLLGREYWSETNFNSICHRDDVLVSLTPLGFLYYLPGLLIFMLNSYENIDVLGSTVAHILTPPLDNMNIPRDSWKRNYYDALNLQQLNCVRDSMLYVMEVHNDGLFDNALESIWFELPS